MKPAAPAASTSAVGSCAVLRGDATAPRADRGAARTSTAETASRCRVPPRAGLCCPPRTIGSPPSHRPRRGSAAWRRPWRALRPTSRSGGRNCPLGARRSVRHVTEVLGELGARQVATCGGTCDRRPGGDVEVPLGRMVHRVVGEQAFAVCRERDRDPLTDVPSRDRFADRLQRRSVEQRDRRAETVRGRDDRTLGARHDSGEARRFGRSSALQARR